MMRLHALEWLRAGFRRLQLLVFPSVDTLFPRCVVLVLGREQLIHTMPLLPCMHAHAQMGLVRFNNFTLADNGAGPLQHIVNGKDNGANYELTWVVDDRSRINTDITNMAGLQNAMLIGRTQEVRAGGWRAGEGVKATGRKGRTRWGVDCRRHWHVRRGISKL